MNYNRKCNIPEEALQYADITLRLPVAVLGFVREKIYKTGPWAQQSSPSGAGALMRARTLNCLRTEAVVQKRSEELIGNGSFLKGRNEIESKHADEIPGKLDQKDELTCNPDTKVRKNNDSLTSGKYNAVEMLNLKGVNKTAFNGLTGQYPEIRTVPTAEPLRLHCPDIKERQF